MKGNVNDSKHTHSSCRQGIGNRRKRKTKEKKIVYVSLLVSNYLHLLNANQKLEVKLFNVSSFLSIFSLFRSYSCACFNSFIFGACGWIRNVSKLGANTDGYEHYLCICHPVYDENTIYLIRWKCLAHTHIHTAGWCVQSESTNIMIIASFKRTCIESNSRPMKSNKI